MRKVSLGLMTMFLEFHVFADSDEEGFPESGGEP